MKSAPEISPREAAVRLGIRLDVLYPLLRIGRLRARKKDGRWLVKAEDVAARVRDQAGRKANQRAARLKTGRRTESRALLSLRRSATIQADARATPQADERLLC